MKIITRVSLAISVNLAMCCLSQIAFKGTDQGTVVIIIFSFAFSIYCIFKE